MRITMLMWLPILVPFLAFWNCQNTSTAPRTAVVVAPQPAITVADSLRIADSLAQIARLAAASNFAQHRSLRVEDAEARFFAQDIIVGAERSDIYLPMLAGHNVALVVNQTSTVGKRHLVDSLLAAGVNVVKIFAPEHGFRGTADAGAKIKDGKDDRTGLPVVSLYGKRQKPTAEDMRGVTIVVFDVQDVGARFYTYISTMTYAMEACAESNVPFLVLDRPNPNGHYVDGPVRRADFKSFVGLHAVPVVHGMTVAEYARMVNDQRWLSNGLHCHLLWVSCLNYDHTKHYRLPVKPSPNLPNMKSIYLYPSLCPFEGTSVSVGRGTETPFQLYGHPDFQSLNTTFTPAPREGATEPKWKGYRCKGYSFAQMEMDSLQKLAQFDLSHVIKAYESSGKSSLFFESSRFFNLLVGNDGIQRAIVEGKTAADLRATWQAEVDSFKLVRKKYLLYPDFE